MKCDNSRIFIGYAECDANKYADKRNSRVLIKLFNDSGYSGSDHGQTGLFQRAGQCGIGGTLDDNTLRHGNIANGIL